MSGEDFTSSRDDEELPTPFTSSHYLMANGKNEVNKDSLDITIESSNGDDDDDDDGDEPSYDEVLDMLREASKYIAKEKKKN
ncbi:Os10g0233310 [Oryza sativa Japonica Group]|uniref:Os10g0233310 protein n=1 Tax=Oryza sativa subsp. japonica TaxID=39947 RepID=A0A0P0XSR3_ORYSJ|nr:Os10g0233310 [Oryza sativa Japonica Group]